ncbi:MAG TPA: PAAR domain-containing protein [Blastocatellia bacterium]|nr:PAAR domain-containing protein [Blastocatellia bacterium]
MFPAARIGDPITHDLLVPSGVIGPPMVPPTGGPVIIEGLPAAFVTCTVVCSGAISVGLAHPPPVPPPPVLPPIVKGSLTVLIYNRPAARWVMSGDLGVCGVQLGDPKLVPTRRVLIGG